LKRQNKEPFMPDLDASAILGKTESGMLAIKERDRSLAPRARTLLIMVDGVKSVAQLAALNTDAIQGAALLKQLLETGFVTVLNRRLPLRPHRGFLAFCPPRP
jgi:hypothetical protein